MSGPDNAGVAWGCAMLLVDIDRIIADLRVAFPRVIILDQYLHGENSRTLINGDLEVIDDPREATICGRIQILLPTPDWEPRRVTRYIYADRLPYLTFQDRPGLTIGFGNSWRPDPQPAEYFNTPFLGFMSMSTTRINCSYDKTDPRDLKTLKTVKSIIFKGSCASTEIGMPDHDTPNYSDHDKTRSLFQVAPLAAEWALSAPNHVIGARRFPWRGGHVSVAYLPVGWESAPAKQCYVQPRDQVAEGG